jgi:hypothetical protein
MDKQPLIHFLTAIPITPNKSFLFVYKTAAYDKSYLFSMYRICLPYHL